MGKREYGQGNPNCRQHQAPKLDHFGRFLVGKSHALLLYRYHSNGILLWVQLATLRQVSSYTYIMYYLCMLMCFCLEGLDRVVMCYVLMTEFVFSSQEKSFRCLQLWGGFTRANNEKEAEICRFTMTYSMPNLKRSKIIV